MPSFMERLAGEIEHARKSRAFKRGPGARSPRKILLDYFSCILMLLKPVLKNSTKIWHGTPNSRYHTNVFRARHGKFFVSKHTNRIHIRNPYQKL